MSKSNRRIENRMSKMHKLKARYKKDGWVVLDIKSPFANMIVIYPPRKILKFIRCKKKKEDFGKLGMVNLKKKYDYLDNKFQCAFEVV
jgi:hypothetical protein